MHYTAEIRLIGGNLGSAMTRMQGWLTENRMQPDAFRYSCGTPITTVRVDFKSENDALSFAKEFRGRVVGAPATAYVVG